MNTRESQETQQMQQTLVRTAFAGLAKLWDEERGGFKDALRESGEGLSVVESKKLNYNCACLIALLDYLRDSKRAGEAERYCRAQARYLLSRFEKTGFPVPSFENATQRDATVGEQGLLLWALSKSLAAGVAPKNAARRACEELAEKIARAIDERDGVPQTLGSRYFVPMDNAFCLRGLIESERAGVSGKGETAADAIASALIDDAATPPVFRVTKNRETTNRISFNNLVYPLYSLSDYASTRKNAGARARETVAACAEALAAEQGPLGQWWWTYDRFGGIAMRYPVYGVHQDGMAPMALKRASAALGSPTRFDAAIEKSLRWVFGENELRARLVDEERGVVWRSIRCPWLVQKLRQVTGFTPEVFLRVKKECRSYHLAWILHAAKC